MNQNKLIALTGGIGVGKNFVAGILAKNFDVAIFDCDVLSKEISEEDSVKLLLTKEFGSEIITANNKLDRKKLGQIVFKDKMKLDKLNKLMHPLIFDKLKLQVSQCEKSLIFVMIPLLLETNKMSMFDEVWFVTATMDSRIMRVMSRDGLTKQEVEDRINNQAKDENLSKIAHIIINNDTDLIKLESRLNKIMGEYDIKKIT